SGGIFLDMLSHDVDMARWLMGDEVKRVYARGGNYLVEDIRETGDLDFAEILIEFSRGEKGFIQGARRNAFGYDLRTEVYGTKGTVYVDTRLDPALALASREGIRYRGVSWFEKRFYEAYVAEIESFAEAITEDKKPLIDGVDGYRAVKIAEACWESHRKGEPVNVDYEL
ncbi:MAG: Gfo/Idh/MocA family oxidoreductase, partial [Desulfurococcales archaeon]|nr:Gfo/Idh/MocA family oxidoreductase [Desulfurococcales archaeon]